MTEDEAWEELEHKQAQRDKVLQEISDIGQDIEHAIKVLKQDVEPSRSVLSAIDSLRSAQAKLKEKDK